MTTYLASASWWLRALIAFALVTTVSTTPANETGRAIDLFKGILKSIPIPPPAQAPSPSTPPSGPNSSTPTASPAPKPNSTQSGSSKAPEAPTKADRFVNSNSSSHGNMNGSVALGGPHHPDIGEALFNRYGLPRGPDFQKNELTAAQIAANCRATDREGRTFDRILEVRNGAALTLCKPDPTWTAPQANVPLAQAERRAEFVVEPRSDDPSVLVSNPYLPLGPIEPTPGRRISHSKYLGFFGSINKMQCTVDGGLRVQASAWDSAAGYARDRDSASGGYWAIDQQGAILPILTARSNDLERIPISHCTSWECRSASPETWSLALHGMTLQARETEGAPYKPSTKKRIPVIDAVEDKHGNVWVARHCALSKFKPDGTEQVIIKPDQCEELSAVKQDYNSLRPKTVLYDAQRDEIVLHTEMPLNPDASTRGVNSAIWRVNQDGQLTEVISTHWAGPRPTKNKHFIKGNIVSIHSVSLDPQGRIWFSIPEYSGDTLASIMRVDPGSNTARVVMVNKSRQSDTSPVYVDGPLATAKVKDLGAACFDAQGNWYVREEGRWSGQRGVIRRLDAKSQRLTTWVF
jgi:hypothetical protein